MREEDFIKSGGMLIFGLLSAIIGLLVLIVMVPYFKIAGGTALIASFFFVVIWLVVYIGLVVGSLVIHFLQEMEGKPKRVVRAPRRRSRRTRRKRRR